MSDTSSLTHLGQEQTKYVYTQPESNLLEPIDNLHQDASYIVPIIMRDVEFTSLCPKTGQPDWAKIHVIYIPDKKLVESKSLKLYYSSFRNHGEFHEDCVNRICKDINECIKPKWIRVIGDFNDRGGLAIKPFVECYNSHTLEIQELITRYDAAKLSD